jgi:prepilin-type processing-associated H-X9-DG protein
VRPQRFGQLRLGPAQTDYSNYYGKYAPDERSGSGTAYRHPGQTANFLFFDGHVEARHWRTIYVNWAYATHGTTQ